MRADRLKQSCAVLWNVSNEKVLGSRKLRMWVGHVRLQSARKIKMQICFFRKFRAPSIGTPAKTKLCCSSAEEKSERK